WAGIPVSEDAWFKGGAAAWERAIALSKRLKLDAGQDLLKALRDKLLITNQFAFACQVSDLLIGCRLPEGDGCAILARLTGLAQAHSGREARHLLEAAVAWAQRLNDEEARDNLLHGMVQSWVTEGDEHAN